MSTEFPAHACDCHFHIMDLAAPTVANPSVPNRNAPVREFRTFAAEIGMSRGVVVQPSLYGTDNALTLRALRDLGPAYRAVVVIDPSIEPESLKAWHAEGVRGVRFNQVQAGATAIEMMPDIARLIAELGWHIQLHIQAERLPEIAGILRELPLPIVLDHFGRMPLPAGTAHPAWRTVRGLLDTGKLWMKLSGPYHISRDGSADYADAVALARELVKVAPDRVVWGSDWPHVTEPKAPAPAVQRQFVKDCLDNHVLKTLVINPALLYGFTALT